MTSVPLSAQKTPYGELPTSLNRLAVTEEGVQYEAYIKFSKMVKLKKA
jgi:hypothetical protein